MMILTLLMILCKSNVINLKWQNDNVEFPKNAINYYSYSKGLRIKDII
jgi:hypothetical protein